MPEQLLYSDHVVLGAGGGQRVGPATLHLAGGHITAVDEGGPIPDGAEDLSGHLLAPAFVNAHTHLSMSAFRGIGGLASKDGNVVEDLYFRLEASLQPGDVRAFARMGAWEALCAGTGTVWEHYYGGQELVDALRDVGLGGVVAFTLQDLAGPGRTGAAAALDATVALAEDADARAAGIVAALGPHATDTVSSTLFGRIADLAEAHDLPLHLHCAQTVDEVRRAWERHGCSPVQWLHGLGLLDAGPSRLLVHGLYLDDADLDAVTASGSTLGFCPASQAWYDFPAHLRSWRERGCAWVLGTDAGACNDTMNIQAELRLVGIGDGFAPTWGPAHDRLRAEGGLAAAEAQHAARQAWFRQGQRTLPPETVLAAVWSTPGDLHPRLPVGRLRPGARADILAFDLGHPALWPALDPLHALVHCDAAPALARSWQGGRDLGRPAALLETAAFRDHAREARRRLSLLLDRAGLSGGG